jgi:hydrogenase maturation protease
MSTILIAGMGNVLRRDDGFGVEVARRLTGSEGLPQGTRVIEVGIGGIHLVQELMAGYELLVIIDAVERGSAPGTVHVLEAEVPALEEWPELKRQDFLADMHYTTPSQAMILARALNVLPPKVYIVGCQPVEVDDLGIGLSEVVEGALAEAVRRIEQLAQRFAAAS